MSVPFRILAIAEGEQRPEWHVTLDAGVTFAKAGRWTERVHCSQLVLVAHGFNDVQIANQFGNSQKLGFQPAGKYEGT